MQRVLSSVDLSETRSAAACLPEATERANLALVWEWFLLEVVGAAPPALLWTTVQEPIVPSARRRIRESLAALHGSFGAQSSTPTFAASLLACVRHHTQIERLLE